MDIPKPTNPWYEGSGTLTAACTCPGPPHRVSMKHRSPFPPAYVLRRLHVHLMYLDVCPVYTLPSHSIADGTSHSFICQLYLTEAEKVQIIYVNVPLSRRRSVTLRSFMWSGQSNSLLKRTGREGEQTPTEWKNLANTPQAGDQGQHPKADVGATYPWNCVTKMALHLLGLPPWRHTSLIHFEKHYQSHPI